MGVFIDISRNGSSLGVIGSWASKRRVEVLGEMDDDVALVRSSTYKGGSDNNGSGLVKAKEAGPSEEIGPLGVNLSGNCSRVSAKRRVLIDWGNGGSTWVIEDKDLTRILSFE